MAPGPATRMVLALVLLGAAPAAAAGSDLRTIEIAGVSKSLAGRRAIGRRPSSALRPAGRPFRLASRPLRTAIDSLLVVFQGPDPYVAGMSRDGDAIVGNHPSGHPAGIGEAVLWTVADGEIALTPAHEYSWARAISADGSQILGEWALVEGAARHFLWSLEGGFSFLMEAGMDLDATPIGMSADGRVFVGAVYDDEQVRHAWTWSEENGSARLPSPFPGGDCVATDVSDDGQVVVGSCGTRFVDPATPSERAAVRWDVGSPPTVLQISGPLSRVFLDPPCHASAVTGDGNVVVGACGGAARRWGRTGPSTLDAPIEGWTDASAVSRDGRVVVGTWTQEPQTAGIPRNDPNTMSAVVWLPSGEMRELSNMLVDLGLTTELAEWKRLSTARAVSDDGRVIAGTGILATPEDPEIRGVYRAELRARRTRLPVR